MTVHLGAPGPTHCYTASSTTVTPSSPPTRRFDTLVPDGQRHHHRPGCHDLLSGHQAYCCGIGITNVSIANINNNSADAIDSLPLGLHLH